jgi:hypothetical protein
MKFGKLSQLILAIGIFAIAVVFLYRTNQGRAAEHEQLNTQLQAVQLLVPKLVSENEDLESRLNQVQAELDQARTSLSQGKAKFPDSIDSVDYNELLFQMANNRDLEMMRLVTSEPAEQSVGNITYDVTTFDIEVMGQVADILDFVNSIASGEEFTTATVELVNITVPEPLTMQEKENLAAQEQEEAEEKPEAPSAVIKVTIYSYKGD